MQKRFSFTNHTHDWSKFCTPDELRQVLASHALQVQDVSGIVFRPSLHGLKFSIDPDDIAPGRKLSAL